MKTIYIVICNNGDGSNSLEWHRTMSPEKLEELENNDEYEKYMSGDGVQVTELQMPDTLDLESWAFFNNITWYEDTPKDEF